MSKPLKFITVRLDVQNLDESIMVEQIKGIHIEYENIGEGVDDWMESVPFEVVKIETEV